MRNWSRASLVAGLLTVCAVVGPAAAAPVTGGPVVGQTVLVSNLAACSTGSAEVETAVDPVSNIVYEEWICQGGLSSGIGFARSLDGGKTFGPAVMLPGSAFGWDPAITVGPNGHVYAAFMATRGSGNHVHTNPVVDISQDQGQTFPVSSSLVPPRSNNWGDRDFVAVGPHGAIYVTWDYGPKNLTLSDFVCPPNGSCSFVAGDVNIVVQKSTDGGATWSKITPVSPGFPGSGADIGPILSEPNGRLVVLYQGYQIVNRRTLKFGVAHSFFTASTDFGAKWSRPVRLGPQRLSMNNSEWWIDGSIGRDTAGKLYATWDTQSGGRDVGWLTYSGDDGRTWARLVRVTPDNDRAVHIVQVIGGAAGIAYVAWQTDAPAGGYTTYLRAFSIQRGWLTPAIKVSPKYGNRKVWPGDTLGLTLLNGGSPGAQQVIVSYGTAIGSAKAHSQIWATVVSNLP